MTTPTTQAARDVLADAIEVFSEALHHIESANYGSYLDCKMALSDLRSLAAQPAASGEAPSPKPAGLPVAPFNIALNTMHANCHEAADAFWNYWREIGETHKKGYYESTWGAINRALRLIGTREHNWCDAIKGGAAMYPAAPTPAQPTPEPAGRITLEQATRLIAALDRGDGGYLAAVEFIHRLRSAHPPVAPLTGAWRPIETAPRDSSRVLVAYKSIDRGWRVHEAWWRLPYESAPMEQCYWCTDGRTGTLLDSSVHKLGASHWQPLPAPPLESALRAPSQPGEKT